MTESSTSKFFGVIACAATLELILAPVPFLWRLRKKKTTDDFQPWPYLATQINFFIWFAYFLSKGGSFQDEKSSNNIYHLLCFGVFGHVGFIVETFYIFRYWYYTTQKNQVVLGCLVLFETVVVELLVVMNLTPLSKIFIAIIPALNVEQSSIWGNMAVVSGVLMYGSPLYNIMNVIRTKSSKYMPFSLCVAMFLCGLSWFICAFTSRIFEPRIAITHGIGTLLGIIQLGLLYGFPATPPTSNIVNVNCVEATLDSDGAEEITVLNTYCGLCKFHVFELEEKIKINPSAKYLLTKDEQGESWIVQTALTSINRSETQIALPFESRWMGHKQTFKAIWNTCLSYMITKSREHSSKSRVHSSASEGVLAN